MLKRCGRKGRCVELKKLRSSEGTFMFMGIKRTAAIDYLIKNHGDGFAMFDPGDVVEDEVMQDIQALINYITDVLDGVIGEEYADPYGHERIIAVDEEPGKE